MIFLLFLTFSILLQIIHGNLCNKISHSNLSIYKYQGNISGISIFGLLSNLLESHIFFKHFRNSPNAWVNADCSCNSISFRFTETMFSLNQKNSRVRKIDFLFLKRGMPPKNGNICTIPVHVYGIFIQFSLNPGHKNHTSSLIYRIFAGCSLNTSLLSSSQLSQSELSESLSEGDLAPSLSLPWLKELIRPDGRLLLLKFKVRDSGKWPGLPAQKYAAWLNFYYW